MQKYSKKLILLKIYSNKLILSDIWRFENNFHFLENVFIFSAKNQKNRVYSFVTNRLKIIFIAAKQPGIDQGSSFFKRASFTVITLFQKKYLFFKKRLDKCILL